MKKYYRINLIATLMSFALFFESTCYAFGSNIYKNILAYSGDYYDTYFYTGAVEAELIHYYGDKKIETDILKQITSDWYVDHIENVIREYYPPPLYNPNAVINAIRKAKDEGKLSIVETVYFDYRTRSVVVLREDLFYGKDILFNLTPEATFHLDYSYCDMDSSVEYSQIAAGMVDFLESIKDIYFDENKRKEHELKGIHERNFNYYWTFLAEKWEKGVDVTVSDVKKMYTKFADIFIDAKSIRMVDKYLEGWIKFDFDLEKAKKYLEENSCPPDRINLFPKTAFYYARFDHNNKQFIIIAGHEILQDNSVKNYVLNKTEVWTYNDSPDVVISVLDRVADIYNHHRHRDGDGGRDLRGKRW